jgi:hypothetical protein
MLEQERGGRRQGGRYGEIKLVIERRQAFARDRPRQGGLQRAEADRAHDDSGGGQLLGGDFRQRFDRGLAGDVGRFAFERKRDGDGGDVDDATGTLTDHDLADGLQAVERAEIVHAHERLGDGARREQEGVHRGGAGVVDQEVDPAAFGDDRHGRPDGGFVGDIDGVGTETFMAQRLRPTGEAMHEPPVGEQFFGQGAAKALGGAGDESGAHF